MSWVEDRLEILDLLARYSHAADGLEPEAYADCFMDDGVFHGRVGMPDEMKIEGREKLLRWTGALMKNRNGRQTRHIQTNTIFEEQGPERAVTRTYLLVMTTEGAKAPEPGLTSVYRDEIVKTPRGWRIKLRQALPDRQGVLPRRREAGQE